MLRGVAAFTGGHRARMTSLNAPHTHGHTYSTGTYVQFTRRNAKTRRWQICERACAHSVTHKQLNIKLKCTRTHTHTAGLPDNEKGVKWVQGVLRCGKAFNTCLDTGERSRPLTVSRSTRLCEAGGKQLAASSLTQNWVSLELQLCRRMLWARQGAKLGLSFQCFVHSHFKTCHQLD